LIDELCYLCKGFVEKSQVMYIEEKPFCSECSVIVKDNIENYLFECFLCKEVISGQDGLHMLLGNNFCSKCIKTAEERNQANESGHVSLGNTSFYIPIQNEEEMMGYSQYSLGYVNPFVGIKNPSESKQKITQNEKELHIVNPELECKLCTEFYSFFNPKYYCPRCGISVCNDCSRQKAPVEVKKTRVCDNCYLVYFINNQKPKKT